jgi:hypothetical protein
LVNWVRPRRMRSRSNGLTHAEHCTSAVEDHRIHTLVE